MSIQNKVTCREVVQNKKHNIRNGIKNKADNNVLLLPNLSMSYSARKDAATVVTPESVIAKPHSVGFTLITFVA